MGPPQTRTDAVRSPEIKKDAVRSSIKFGDVSTRAATTLRGDLRFAEDDNDSVVPVPECDSIDLSDCPNFLVLELGSGGTAQPARNWLVQAEADVHVELALSTDRNLCGLVNTDRRDRRRCLIRSASMPSATQQIRPHQIRAYRLARS